MSKHLDVLQDVCVLTKGGWSPRALRHLLSSMVFSCTPPEHCIYRSLQLCSCTPTFMVHCIGQLKIINKVPLIPQASSKVQIPRNMCEELSTRPLCPRTLSRSKGQRRRKRGLQHGTHGCMDGVHPQMACAWAKISCTLAKVQAPHVATWICSCHLLSLLEGLLHLSLIHI